jgi:PTH1 family peptidyl-tRNA hydrolase
MALPEARARLIVGLGNPGLTYRATRHNAGAQAVLNFAKKNKFVFKADRSLKSLVAEKMFQGHAVYLALPQTFMNLSGEAVLALARKKKINANHILIVCDDVALAPGEIKIKPSGSAGGHNGLASVIQHLGTTEVARLRIGIGRLATAASLSDYVLSPFSKAERLLLQKVLRDVVCALQAWILEGMDHCMNRWNNRSKVREEYSRHEKV